MHPFAILVLTAVVVSLQTVLAPRLEVLGARPDWLLVLVVFLGLYVPPRRSILTAWFVGMCADLMTLERLGFLSLTYTLVALLLAGVRDHIFRYSILTQLACTFLLGVLVQSLWLVYARLLYDWDAGFMMQVFGAALYTAVWAPLMHGAMLRAGRLLGLPRMRRGAAGAVEAGYSDV